MGIVPFSGHGFRLALVLFAAALGVTSGCPAQHEEDLRRFGVAAFAMVPRGGEVKMGTGGAMIMFKGREKYGWDYGVSIIPAGDDHDINDWARTIPAQKEATQFTEKTAGPEGWTLSWKEQVGDGVRYRFVIYRQALNVTCSTTADPATPEDEAAARKICASLRAP